MRWLQVIGVPLSVASALMSVFLWKLFSTSTFEEKQGKWQKSASESARNLTHIGARGTTWLKENLNLILEVDHPTVHGAGDYELFIHPVSKQMTCNASKLELWVRIGGPDIFAGSAIPDINSCSWTFPFTLEQTGEYIVEVKTLMYNGRAEVHPKQCQYLNVNVSQADLPLNASNVGFQGVKLYAPYEGCCEVCTRVPGCTLWSFPTLDQVEGCQLFFGTSNSSVVRLPRKVSGRQLSAIFGNEPAVGYPRNEDAAYYLGCGLSFWMAADFPCQNPDTDDQISNFTLVFNNVQEKDTNKDTRPFCTTADETLEQSRGRWVRRPYPSEIQCPNTSLTTDGNYKASIYEVDPDRPKCWYKDDLTLYGTFCSERGCAIWLSNTWYSWLHKERFFFGTWEQYSCQYKEWTTSQLQECITKKNISSITTAGASISLIVSDYLRIRTRGLHFPNSTENTIEISIDTISFPHLLWHMSTEELISHLSALPVATPLKQKYWLTSFYISSEREQFVHNGRARVYTEVAEPILKAKGWIELNMYDVGAAFAFDTTGQMDGLHLLGPPIKVLMTKLFHHLCQDLDY